MVVAVAVVIPARGVVRMWQLVGSALPWRHLLLLLAGVSGVAAAAAGLVRGSLPLLQLLLAGWVALHLAAAAAAAEPIAFTSCSPNAAAVAVAAAATLHGSSRMAAAAVRPLL